MKKLFLALVAMGAVSANAGVYNWTDFETNQKVMLNLGDYDSKEVAQQASVAAISLIEAGNLAQVHKKMRYIGGDEDCKSL
jgi:hypothetical protein